MVNAKRALKTASFPVFLGLLLLAGCADTSWPSWLTGEPNDRVLHAPRAIGTPAGLKNKTFPNLATVPPKPADFSTAEERNRAIEEMNSDRLKADAAKARLEDTPTASSAEPVLVWPEVVMPENQRSVP